MYHVNFLLILLLLSTACSTVKASKPAENVDTTTAANAVNSFAIDIYRELATEKGNIFFSPFSITSALAMTGAGANGETATQIEKTLHFSGIENDIHIMMHQISHRFNTIPSEHGTMNVVNRLWLDKAETLVKSYQDLIKKYYTDGIESIDYRNDSNNARLKINDWIAEQTRDKIKDILMESDVTPLTRLILTNAIYFNSAWEIPFPKSNTIKMPFYTGKDISKNIDMMTNTALYPYSDSENLQRIKIPYTIPGFSMLILLPKENEDFTQLEELEKQLTAENFAMWKEEMYTDNVVLHLPKFKDEQRYSLSEILKKLGMDLAFSGYADFSNLLKNPKDIYLKDVIHKSFIELDEERTEAAAATVAIVATRGAIIPPPVFNANRPFIYSIIDEETGVVLFMGRFMGS